jgi:hypothetical protein
MEFVRFSCIEEPLLLLELAGGVIPQRQMLKQTGGAAGSSSFNTVRLQSSVAHPDTTAQSDSMNCSRQFSCAACRSGASLPLPPQFPATLPQSFTHPRPRPHARSASTSPHPPPPPDTCISRPRMHVRWKRGPMGDLRKCFPVLYRLKFGFISYERRL